MPTIEGERRFELPDGRAEVTVEVAEGSYAAPRIFVADDHDRKGVIELASFDKFSPTHEVFLEQLMESIGIVLNTIETNTRTEELLEQSQSLTEELRRTNEELQDKAHLLVKQNERNLVLAVHPYLYAYFTSGLISQRMKWYFKYKRWVSLVKDTSMAIIEYKFLNKEGEEIQLN